MTVTFTNSTVTALGNGSAFTFSFSPIRIFLSTELEVRHVAADGTTVVRSEGTGATNYIVKVSKYPGTGSITYPADQLTPMAADEKLIIRLKPKISQEVDFVNQGGYFSETNENAHDRGAMVDLYLQEQVDRAVKAPVGESPSFDLPALDDRALKVLGFDAGGDITTYTIGFGLNSLEDVTFNDTVNGVTRVLHYNRSEATPQTFIYANETLEAGTALTDLVFLKRTIGAGAYPQNVAHMVMELDKDILFDKGQAWVTLTQLINNAANISGSGVAAFIQAKAGPGCGSNTFAMNCVAKRCDEELNGTLSDNIQTGAFGSQVSEDNPVIASAENEITDGNTRKMQGRNYIAYGGGEADAAITLAAGANVNSRAWSGNPTSGTGTTVVLPNVATVSGADNYYANNYFYVSRGTGSSDFLEADGTTVNAPSLIQITGYVASTRTLTLASALPTDLDGTSIAHVIGLYDSGAFRHGMRIIDGAMNPLAGEVIAVRDSTGYVIRHIGLANKNAIDLHTNTLAEHRIRLGADRLANFPNGTIVWAQGPSGSDEPLVELTGFTINATSGAVVGRAFMRIADGTDSGGTPKIKYVWNHNEFYPDTNNDASLGLSLKAWKEIYAYKQVFKEQASVSGDPSTGNGWLYALTDGKLYFENDAGTVFDLTAAAAASSFTGLSDTPASYSSQASKLLRVNSGETALEFIDNGIAGLPETVEFTGTAKTLAPADLGKELDCTAAGLVTITVDSAALPTKNAETVVYLYASGAAGISVVGGGTTPANLRYVSGLATTIPQYGAAMLKWKSGDDFRLTGNLNTA